MTDKEIVEEMKKRVVEIVKEKAAQDNGLSADRLDKRNVSRKIISALDEVMADED